MSDATFDPSMNDGTIFGLQIRNREAEKVIGSYAKNHRWLDVGVGLAGFLVPGGSIAAMIACMAAQGPVFYKPMAIKLAKIYLSPVDHHTKRIVSEAMLEGAMWDINNELTAGLFTEIATELVTELGWGAAASFIPVFGGFVGAALDAVVAATMTWRVGTMISVYYQNGGDWLGSRRDTFEVAKDFVGGPSPKADNRVNLDDVVRKNNEVLQRQFSTLKTVLLDSILDISSDEEVIVSTLRKRGVSEDLIKASIPYIRSRIEEKLGQ
jgi:uncharacterized protein (DUF697 family)